ncbi:MAG: hypothetical protein FWG61_05455, partial [Firmicutes bacterium]|nr:hypothetical protein [Bacillota bacterium]
MNMNIQKTIIKILSKCLLWVVIAAAGFVYLPHVFGLAGAVKYAQGAEKKADAPWYNLLTELPKGQKSFFSMAKTLNLSAWRFSGNYWNYGTDINNTKSIPADRTNDRDILLKALLHEWEFRVALPKEVADELGAGYSVEIAAKGDWGLNESELFFLKDPASFQYKLEDKYLYIKAYPQIRIRDDVFFNKLITNYDIRVPLVEPRYGVNTFAMFDFNGTDLGSASGYMKIDRPSMSQLQEELEYCAENKWIHPTQIINATGVLQGYYNENQMFDIAIWKNDKESIRNSHEVKIGNNTFAPGGAIGLSFWYPLKLSFYLEKNEDVAVTNITYTPLIPHSQATVTVTVANYGMSAQLPKLSFVVDGVSAKKTVNIVPALQPHEIRELNFDFFTPEEGMLVITAEINPLRSDNTRDFNEVTYDNNIYSVIAPINMPEFGNLPPWVLSKKLIFTTSPPAVAELKLPAACWWAGSAEGTLKVYNITPDLYHDFKARDLHLDAVGLNTVSIAIKRPSASFSEYIKINTKLCREDFGDDPAGILGQPFWAENYDLLKTGIIDTGGSVQRRYGYKWYCGGCSGVDDEICNGHVDYAYAEADFDPIDCRTVYIANVYNGMDELTYQKPVHK